MTVTAGAMVFAGIQTKLSRNAVIAQTWQNLTQPGNDISKVFVDHPRLRPYFYDGKQVKKGDPDFDAVMAVAEMYLDFIDSFQDDYVFDLPGMAKDGENRRLWNQYFKDIFVSSPALCAYAKEKKHWYSEDTLSSYIKEIDRKQLSGSNGLIEPTRKRVAAQSR